MKISRNQLRVIILEALSTFDKVGLKAIAASQGKSDQADVIIDIIENTHTWITADILSALQDAEPDTSLGDIADKLAEVDEDFVAGDIDVDAAKKSIIGIFKDHREDLESL